MSFPFYIYFLSFPSPSFSSEHTKPEALWNLHPWLILGMGFWPKKHILQFGAILVFVPQFFALCFSLSPHLSSLSFSFSSHSVCLQDFCMFLCFATTHSPTLFLDIFGVFGNLRSTKWSLKLFKGEDFALSIKWWTKTQMWTKCSQIKHYNVLTLDCINPKSVKVNLFK